MEHVNRERCGSARGDPCCLLAPREHRGWKRTACRPRTATGASCSTGIPLLTGFYFDKKTVPHGFVDNGGKFTTITVPHAEGTFVVSSNSAGTVVGEYYGAKGGNHGFVDHAGKFTTINDPSAGTAGGQGTTAFNINDLGVISGYFIDKKNVAHGFEDVAGKFTTFTDPGAGSKNTATGRYLNGFSNLGTYVYGVNDGGVVFGRYIDSKGVTHGFEELGDRYTTLDDPSAATSSGDGSAVDQINNLGVIVGVYANDKGVDHGYFDRAGKFSAINDPRAGSGNGRAPIRSPLTTRESPSDITLPAPPTASQTGPASSPRSTIRTPALRARSPRILRSPSVPDLKLSPGFQAVAARLAQPVAGVRLDSGQPAAETTPLTRFLVGRLPESEGHHLWVSKRHRAC